MKALALLLAITLPSAAQSVFTNGTTVHSGSGGDQKSNAYEFKGPYVLQWGLRDVPPSKRDDPYWKPTTDEEWKRRWLSVRVHDAATGKQICGEMLDGRDNHFNVPEGGKHYVVVSGPDNIAWVIQAKEGRVVVTEQGERLEQASAGGRATAPERPSPEPSSPALPDAYRKWADALLASVKAEPEGPRREAAAKRALAEIEKMNRKLGIKNDQVPEPKPSSVPGLPPGVEPAKKDSPVLPPGMTKGGNSLTP